MVKRTRRYLHKISRYFVTLTHYVVKRLHHHVAKRPHNYFMKKITWYRKWHQWELHSHAHASVLVVYLFVVAASLLFFYQQAYAAQSTQSWDFSNAAEFEFDDTKVETIGTSARLKAQNYSNDAQTAALYHFDELNGSSVTDSSSNGNNGTITDATFNSGVLNNSLEFNGTTSAVTIPDSLSLSFGQQNTLEAWTKFNTSFSAGSDTQRQTIIDKGDYQLYYNNETGKVSYELADRNSTNWSLAGGNDVNGGWDQNGKRSVNVVTKMGSDFYYGIGSDVGDAEVWQWNGSTWTHIGGGPNSINNSWDANTYEGVYSLISDGSTLYAGLGTGAGDGEVWRWNGSTWTKIGGDSVNGGWTNYAEQVWTLEIVAGNLYAGIGNGGNDAEVWEWNGSTWTQIGGDSLNSGWTTNYERVAALTTDGTNLYAGVGSSANDAEVWRWNGSAWSKIGGDSINSGWTTNYETVNSLRYFGGSLYAGIGDSTNDAEVWQWNGSAWSKIGGDGVNSSWNSSYEQVASFAFDGTNLYAGLGTGNGDGEVWQWNGSAWSKIGGDGLDNSWVTNQGDTVNTLLFDSGVLYSGSYDSGGAGLAYTWNGTTWTQIGGDYVNKSWGFFGFSAAQVMQAHNDYLYVGMGNTTGSAVVFRFDGSTWTAIGGQGINNSWEPNKYEYVYSMGSYENKLYVGLGNTANSTDQDGEIWEWDGSTWTKVAGNGINGSWSGVNNYGEVDSLASYDGYLYAGLGQGSNNGEVWRYNGSTWTQIGGDSLNGGWTNYAENVYSLAVYDGKLVAGLGRSGNDSEVWEWNGSTWTKIGGDDVNSSWGTGIVPESVESLIPYNGKLYAGLGNSTGDASLWEYNGTAWTKIGGDDINGSWTTGTYERVKTLVVYNGSLFAGLGSSTGDGEVWRYSSGNWTKIGGNGINAGWTNSVEEVQSFSPYKGKLYAGTGNSTNSDNLVWSYGDNGYLESSIDSFDTSWHHVAATYDGTTMRLYIDGVLDGEKTTNLLLPDSDRPLRIGTSYGGREYGKAVGTFNGAIDEVRISSVARTTFTSNPYSSQPQTITLADAVFTSGIESYSSFTTDETLNGGTITYQLSDNDGDTWQYWNGGSWAEVSTLSNANPATEINDNIPEFPISYDGLKWRAILRSNGDQLVTLNLVGVEGTQDYVAPDTNAANIVANKSASGAAISAGAWTNGSSPYFSWDAGTDAGAGIYGYCLYLGQDNTADLTTTKGYLGTTPAATGDHCQFITQDTSVDLATPDILGTPLVTSTSNYYLLVRAIDYAGNVAAVSESFSFRFDNTPPNNPGFISAPSGFINTKDTTLTWPTNGAQAPNDGASGLAGLQYRISPDGNWYGDVHDGTGSTSDLLVNDGVYETVPTPDHDSIVEGTNTVYFRTWDVAGNVTTSYVSAALKINTNGSPSEPTNLSVSQATNTVNDFSFSWSPPDTFVGDVSSLNYCYTVNVAPSAAVCNYTGNGIRSLSGGPYATSPGANTLYVVARDESSNINYESYATVQFTANTAAPGVPGNTDIVDVSIKASAKWRIAITWDTPTTNFDGITSYRIFRSTDNVNFVVAGTSSSTTYIDAGLQQQLYHYRITACDSTSNCSANSTTVSLLPTGKFTEPAAIISEPEVSNVTTRRTDVTWITDRASDSKIAIGTVSGKYSSAEIGNSDQVSIHTIELDNLAAGTTYYYVVKWTDADGNTGVSQEQVFTTAPAPVVKEVNAAKVGLTDAVISFTSVNAVKANLYYGPSESFGGLRTVNTSNAESSYSLNINGLNDGTKYFYQISAIDSEGTEYKGNIFSFTTPPRPQITNLRFEPVKGKPTSTQQVTWNTNVPSTSTLTYGKVGLGGVDVQDSKLKTDHSISIAGLQDDSQYYLIAQSRDGNGNLAVSDQQNFRTALDTRPPSVFDVAIESSIRGTGSEARGQVIVSWKTDEPSTSQVGYAEGSTATVFSNKTSEDTQLTTEHIVVLSNLPTSQVYSIQAISYDTARNIGEGEPQTAIIGRANESVLTLIINSLQRIFGL